MISRLSETLNLLSKARQFVADGERFLTHQKAYVDKLELRGENTSNAENYLETLEEMQEVYVEHMEKLERQVMVLVKPDLD